MNLIPVHPQRATPPLNQVQVLDTPVMNEVWTRDDVEQDLWHGPHGVIVNTPALEERKRFYRLIQLR